MARALARLVLILLTLLTANTAARAHATLVFAHPEDGALLDRAPASVRLRFNEPVTPLVARLVDASGALRENLAVNAAGDAIDIAMPAGLGDGAHTLSYRVTSADGHPVGGALTFSIGHRGASSGVAANGARALAIWSLRALGFFTALLGVGGVAFLALIARAAPSPPARRAPRYTLTTAALCALASLGAHGLDMVDRPAAALLDTSTWRAAALSPHGLTVGATLAACLIAALALFHAGKTAGAAFALAAFVLCAAAFAASGHAAVAPPQWATRPAVFAHVAALLLLLGPLPTLAGWWTAPGDARAALRRFAPAAGLALAALTASGLLIAVVQVESFAALAETSYGWIFLAKLALVTVVAALVVVARRASPRNRPRFARAQLALVAAILALTAGWRFTPPPRALAPASRVLHIHTDKMMAMVTFSPALIGPNNVRVELMSGDFGPFEAREVVLSIVPRDGAIEPLTRPARRTPEGDWRVDDLRVPYPGAWTVSVEALVTDFDKLEISEDLVFQR